MKTQNALYCLAALLSLSAVACGASSPAGDTANISHQAHPCSATPGCPVAAASVSCTDNSGCTDYTGADPAISAAFQRACAQAGSSFAAQPCATLAWASALVGSCKENGGTAGETVAHYYAASGVTTDSVQSACLSASACDVFCAP